MHAKTIRWARLPAALHGGGWWVLGWLALLPPGPAMAETSPGPPQPVVHGHGQTRLVWVSIEPVDNLEAFLRAEQALAALTGVTERELLEVTPRQLVYRLQVRGGLKGLRASLTQEAALRIVAPAPVSDEAVEPDLRLRLRP